MQPILSGDDRFILERKIANTLQGLVCVASDKSKNRLCIVKKARKWCVEEFCDTNGMSCGENFPNEKAILYYLTNLAQRGNNHRGNNHLSSLKIENFPFNTNGIVKICDEWDDDKWFYYAMEHCRHCDLMTYFKAQFDDPNGILQKRIAKYSNIPINRQLPVKSGRYNPWLKMVRDIFQQLVLTVAWMHENGVCHLDLSLENVMISDINTLYGNEKLTVKIIDCGIAQYFGNENLVQRNEKYNQQKNATFLIYKNIIESINSIITHNIKQKENVNNQLQKSMPSSLKTEYEKIQRGLNNAHPTFTNFQTHKPQNNSDNGMLFGYNRCVGKNGYMAPEVRYKVSNDGKFTKRRYGRYERSHGNYDARKADIWTLGVMLFMMCVGSPLYQLPNPDCLGFRYAFTGKLRLLLAYWKRGPFVTRDILDLLEKIFQPAKKRIIMDELLQHPFLGLNLDVDVAEEKHNENDVNHKGKELQQKPITIEAIKNWERQCDKLFENGEFDRLRWIMLQLLDGCTIGRNDCTSDNIINFEKVGSLALHLINQISRRLNDQFEHNFNHVEAELQKNIQQCKPNTTLQQQAQQAQQVQPAADDNQQSDNGIFSDLGSVCGILQNWQISHEAFGKSMIMIEDNEFQIGTRSYYANDIDKFSNGDENLVYKNAWKSVSTCFELSNNYWFDAIQESINYCQSLSKIICKYLSVGKMNQVNGGIKLIEQLRDVSSDIKLHTSQLYNELRYVCGKFGENGNTMFRCQFSFGKPIFMSCNKREKIKHINTNYNNNIDDSKKNSNEDIVTTEHRNISDGASKSEGIYEINMIDNPLADLEFSSIVESSIGNFIYQALDGRYKSDFKSIVAATNDSNVNNSNDSDLNSSYNSLIKGSECFIKSRIVNKEPSTITFCNVLLGEVFNSKEKRECLIDIICLTRIAMNTLPSIATTYSNDNNNYIPLTVKMDLTRNISSDSNSSNCSDFKENVHELKTVEEMNSSGNLALVELETAMKMLVRESKKQDRIHKIKKLALLMFDSIARSTTTTIVRKKVEFVFNHLLRAMLMFNYRKRQENICHGGYVTLTVNTDIGDTKNNRDVKPKWNIKYNNNQLQSNDKYKNNRNKLPLATNASQTVEQFDLQLIEYMCPKSLGNMTTMDWVVLMMKYLSTFGMCNVECDIDTKQERIAQFIPGQLNTNSHSSLHERNRDYVKQWLCKLFGGKQSERLQEWNDTKQQKYYDLLMKNGFISMRRICQGLSNVEMNAIGIKNEIDQCIMINDLINNKIGLNSKQKELQEKIVSEFIDFGLKCTKDEAISKANKCLIVLIQHKVDFGLVNSKQQLTKIGITDTTEQEVLIQVFEKLFLK